jgi:hypothetical protein
MAQGKDKIWEEMTTEENAAAEALGWSHGPGPLLCRR